MAVPKKKTSKAKKRARKAVWKRKASFEAEKALSLGKAVLSGRSSFIYPQQEDEEQEES